VEKGIAFLQNAKEMMPVPVPAVGPLESLVLAKPARG
jgi:hypothetical protein